MNKDSKIYIAGHTGLVGSSICKKLISMGYSNIIVKSSMELDLTQQKETEDFFEFEKPEYIFLAAAKVGGIHANEMYPAEFIYNNLIIECNVINSAHKNNAKKLMLLGSGCIYPRIVPQPIKEEYLLTAPLEKTNEAYAISKIAGLKLCEYYNKQYGSNFISVMPCNLYGPGDNYHLENSHVIPALIRKFHEAKKNRLSEVILWGTGNALREFMHVDDMAEACIFLMNIYQDSSWINIGYGKDITIKVLAEKISAIIGYEGKILFDARMPDGTPRKLLDSTKINEMGWTPKVDLTTGLQETYNDYVINYERYRR